MELACFSAKMRIKSETFDLSAICKVIYWCPSKTKSSPPEKSAFTFISGKFIIFYIIINIALLNNVKENKL